jgi:hypothetical protein
VTRRPSFEQRCTLVPSGCIRSVAETGDHIRAVRYTETTYSAFQVGGDVERTYTHGEMLSCTLDEAVTEALTRKLFDHKDHLLIREEGPKGVKLHLYAIKRKSQARYVHQDHVTRRVHDLYPAHVCTIDGAVLMGAFQ